MDSRIEALLAQAQNPEDQRMLEHLRNVLAFGNDLMELHGVATMPDLPEGAYADFLRYAEDEMPGAVERIFGGVN